MRILVWNLFHGRADPPAGRPLLREFADALAGWEWDVALLQEVPPWWPRLLAGCCEADWRSAPTSRNQLLPLRRAVASRAPDLLRSNGGGANAILVRAPWTITAHGRRRLRAWPERRVVHAVRIARPEGQPSAALEGGGAVPGPAGGTIEDPAGARGSIVGGLPAVARDPWDGAWVGNVHTQLGSWDSAEGRTEPLADLTAAVEQLDAWACAADGSAGRPASGHARHTSATAAPIPAASPPATPTTPPIVLGGDFNLPRDAVAGALPDGWARIASSGPDHVAGRGVRAGGPSSRPERGALSDHAPLLVEITRCDPDLVLRG